MSSHWSHCTWHQPHRESTNCQVTGHTAPGISPTVPIVKSLVTLGLASAPQYQLSSHWSHCTWHQPHSTNCQVTGHTAPGISPTGKVPIVKSLVTLHLASAPQGKYQLSSHWSHCTWHQPHSTNCQVTGHTGSGISPTGKVPIVKSLVTLHLASAPQYQLSSHWSHWIWHQPHSTNCQVTGHTGPGISPTVPIVKSLVTLDLASAPQEKYQLSSHWSHWI